MSCFMDMCFFKLAGSPVEKSHLSQRKFFNLRWTCSVCLFKWTRWYDLYGHLEHIKTSDFVWTHFVCSVRPLLLKKPFSQRLHWKSRRFSWTLAMWVLSFPNLSRVLKTLLQISQAICFDGSSILRWTTFVWSFKRYDLDALYGQSGHWKILAIVWIFLMWALRALRLEKLLSHWLHSTLQLSSWSFPMWRFNDDFSW